MSQKSSGASKVSEWMKVVQVGQLTRDASLKTKSELEADKKQADNVAELRKKSA